MAEPAMDEPGEVIRRAAGAGIWIVTAESCTAGLVADLLAGVSGASRALWGGYVCYTPEAKARMLGIDGGLLRQYGAVSRETALAMAQGARERSGAQLAVSVTGLAGPLGDGSSLPVGTVWIGVAEAGETGARLFNFSGNREEIRRAAAREALRELLKRLKAV
jgi:PncC family amidohydrolase